MHVDPFMKSWLSETQGFVYKRTFQVVNGDCIGKRLESLDCDAWLLSGTDSFATAQKSIGSKNYADEEAASIHT